MIHEKYLKISVHTFITGTWLQDRKSRSPEIHTIIQSHMQRKTEETGLFELRYGTLVPNLISLLGSEAPLEQKNISQLQ